MQNYIDAEFEASRFMSKTFTFRAQPIEVRIYDNSDRILWVHFGGAAKVMHIGNVSAAMRSVLDSRKRKEISTFVSSHETWFITLEGLRGLASRKRTHRETATELVKWLDDEVYPVMYPVTETSEIVQSFQESVGVDETNVVAQLLQQTGSAMVELVTQTLEQQSHVFREMISRESMATVSAITHKFDEEVKEMQNMLRETQVEAGVAKETLTEVKSQKEFVEKSLSTTQENARLSHTHSKEYSSKLLKENRELKEKLEDAQRANKDWKKRAKRWGRKLAKRHEDAVHHDEDLALLINGLLED